MDLPHIVREWSFASALVGLGGVVFLALYITSIAYEAFISPLSKYPAPIYCHISHFPVAWHMWHGTLPYWIDRLHKKYGPIVRVSPTELSYTASQAWKDVYGHSRGSDEKKKRGCAKNPRFYGPVRDLDNGTPGILEADDANHARFRRIFSHAFSAKALLEQEPIFEKYTSLLVRRLKDKMAEGSSRGGGFDLSAWYNYTTFDVMADLTFGESLGLLEKAQYAPWIAAIWNSFQAGVVFRSMRYWPPFYRILRLAFGAKLREKRRVQFRFCADSVDRRLARDPTHTHKDLWSLVLAQKEEEGRLTLPEMHTNASAFMMAGTETTATACAGLTYYLLKHPDKMERVVREIRDTFQSEEDMTIVRMQRLEYLQACLDETLRIYPPSVTGFQRITPPEGAEICGRFVPGGTSVYVSNYACFRSELNFRDPEKFIPERFLDTTGAFAHDNRAALQPFSHGPRACMGRHMAYVEMRMIMTKMLWNFDLKLCDEDENWLDQPVFLVFKKRPLLVHVRPRNDWKQEANTFQAM
ncbi:cytochrome P450 [Colletotrichum plurivorum]|uniref:Cytochrome P450 n=1 Tax=Colletotrichum plurivorum TaxID=2175906 RepID=A0A8H6KUH9_9PEZI|nr:cytochrome P450 [Colletotrichum plurivorum]